MKSDATVVIRANRPRQAHEKTLARRYAPVKPKKMIPVMIELITQYIRQDFSPEQVFGFLYREYKITRQFLNLKIGIFCN